MIPGLMLLAAAQATSPPPIVRTVPLEGMFTVVGLSPEGSKKVVSIIFEDRERRVALEQRARQLSAAGLALIRAPQPDIEAIAANLREAQAVRAQLQALKTEGTIKILRSLSSKDRRAYLANVFPPGRLQKHGTSPPFSEPLKPRVD
ncbi:MAG TPA: periplasmic heavy metal sensor [Allosphingosinicella sp.]|nr:periplasmic heavy metal sensor [Allosphingosinicella sp.]